MPMKNFGEKLEETLQVPVSKETRKLIEEKIKGTEKSIADWVRMAIKNRFVLDKIKLKGE